MKLLSIFALFFAAAAFGLSAQENPQVDVTYLTPQGCTADCATQIRVAITDADTSVQGYFVVLSFRDTNRRETVQTQMVRAAGSGTTFVYFTGGMNAVSHVVNVTALAYVGATTTAEAQ